MLNLSMASSTHSRHRTESQRGSAVGILSSARSCVRIEFCTLLESRLRMDPAL
jgi:hypothetical protein